MLKKKIIKSSDFTYKKLNYKDKAELIKKGKIKRMSRGVYSSTQNPINSPYASLAEASQKINSGVICLSSALSFYGIGTELPSEVHVAINRCSHIPKGQLSNIKIYRFSQKSFQHGIKYYDIDGVTVPIYSIEKTITDCFKYRNKMGLDAPLEALHEAFDQKVMDFNELITCSKINRVYKVLKPYLEILLHRKK